MMQQLVQPVRLLGAARLLNLSVRSASSFKNVISDKRGAKKNVGYIQMNHPKVNALSDAHIADILGAMKAHDNDPDVGCLILTGGTGKIFCAGANIDEMKKRDFRKVVKDDFIAVWDNLTHIKKPIIAAVNGVAFGGGCEIAMACDIIIASSKAQFGQPEIKLGTLPGAGGTQRLVRAVGKSKAMEMVLGGEPISADEALRFGLVSRVVPQEQLIDEAIKLAESIARHSHAALTAIKDCVNRSFELSLREGILLERKVFYSSFATHDREEGMKAFLEKREPKWKHE